MLLLTFLYECFYFKKLKVLEVFLDLIVNVFTVNLMCFAEWKY